MVCFYNHTHVTTLSRHKTNKHNNLLAGYRTHFTIPQAVLFCRQSNFSLVSFQAFIKWRGFVKFHYSVRNQKKVFKMPKKNGKNAFMFFVMDFKRKQENRGVRFRGGMPEVTAAASDSWTVSI